MIAQPIVMAVFSPLAGKLSDKIEPRVIASLGMALTTLGLILLALINHHTTLLFIVISLMVLGFGFALFSSPNMNAIMGSVAKKYYGIASGSVGTMRLLGQMLSMGIATLVIALFIGRVPITPDLYPTADQQRQDYLYNFRRPLRSRHFLLFIPRQFEIPLGQVFVWLFNMVNFIPSTLVFNLLFITIMDFTRSTALLTEL